MRNRSAEELDDAGKRLYVFRDPDHNAWVVLLYKSPIMGNAVWMYTTWRECMIHAEIMRRVWNHI